MMYKVGDFIKHNRYGVCQIDELMKRKMSNGEKRQYYVMHTLKGVSTKISTPVDSADLCAITSVEDIDKLFLELPNLPNIWENDNHKRADKFHQILVEGDVFALATMIKSIYEKREEKRKDNKLLQSNDAKLLYQAETKLNDELAFRLKMEPSEVSPFIAKFLEESIK
ncbi:MAG: hypothetical protein EOM50_01235 [Erysipelotrichia bacterium]|nr:hypothetical protein [Erysipelotrichia bacterium]NCC54750.1 hypothetical protein [Erysipelotrichia bacterium]